MFELRGAVVAAGDPCPLSPVEEAFERVIGGADRIPNSTIRLQVSGSKATSMSDVATCLPTVLRPTKSQPSSSLPSANTIVPRVPCSTTRTGSINSGVAPQFVSAYSITDVPSSRTSIPILGVASSDMNHCGFPSRMGLAPELATNPEMSMSLPSTTTPSGMSASISMSREKLPSLSKVIW